MGFWLRFTGFLLQLLARFYGLVIFGAGAVLLYFAGRGTLAYLHGIRAAWTDPLACGAGFIGGALGLWAGTRLLQGRLPAWRFRFAGKTTSPELDATLEEASRLEQEDPDAARQLLDGYFAREATRKDARRAELRARSASDVEAAQALRRDLQEELELGASFRKEVLRKWPEDQRAPMLAELDETEHHLQSELLQLDATIGRLKLR